MKITPWYLAALAPFAAIGCSERTDLITESAPNSLASAAVSPNGVIPDRYFVVFKNRPADLRRSANDLVTPHGGEILFTYEHVFYGFSARLPSAAVEALRNNPNVDRITPEHYVDALTEGD